MKNFKMTNLKWNKNKIFTTIVASVVSFSSATVLVGCGSKSNKGGGQVAAPPSQSQLAGTDHIGWAVGNFLSYGQNIGVQLSVNAYSKSTTGQLAHQVLQVEGSASLFNSMSSGDLGCNLPKGYMNLTTTHPGQYDTFLDQINGWVLHGRAGGQEITVKFHGPIFFDAKVGAKSCNGQAASYGIATSLGPNEGMEIHVGNRVCHFGLRMPLNYDFTHTCRP